MLAPARAFGARPSHTPRASSPGSRPPALLLCHQLCFEATNATLVAAGYAPIELLDFAVHAAEPNTARFIVRAPTARPPPPCCPVCSQRLALSADPRRAARR